MPRRRAHQLGDICYETGKNWRALVHLVRPRRGNQGHYLREIRLIFKPEKVLVVLKKDGPKGPQVAFLDAGNFDECLWVMAQAVTSKSLNWKEDKWVSMRSDKM